MIPREAYEGLMRAWCQLLEEKTGLKWVPVASQKRPTSPKK